VVTNTNRREAKIQTQFFKKTKKWREIITMCPVVELAHGGEDPLHNLPTSTMMLQICVFLGSKTKHGNYNYSMDVIQLVSAFQDTLPSQELGMCVPLL